jgi:malonyl-CoA O-methyltransferase
MRDLRAMGSQNAASSRPRAFTGRGRLATMTAAYESFRTDGLLPATFEAVFGQAWGAVLRERPRHDAPFTVPVTAIGRRRPTR